MRNILIPIDGTERSMKAVDLVKSLYAPDTVNIVLLMVREDIETMFSERELEKAKAELKSTLDAVAEQLEEFHVRKEVVVGRAGDEILDCAEQNKTDIIVMTKSTKSGWFQMIGSVTAHVVKYADCIVMIVPETDSDGKAAPKKIRCTYLDDIVTLAGQLGFKPNSCLLPAQAGRCVYHITVMDGRLRLSHLAYNPDGNTWDLPPKNRQPQYYDMKQGEDREIRLEILVDSGRLDQIEIVNPSMKTPVKFHYTAAFESLDE